MRAASQLPRWAAKVSRTDIRRLYEQDALGLADEQLVDEVAFAIYARIESILEVTEAARGSAKCPMCGAGVHHGARSGETLKCGSCGWECLWDDYRRAYKGKQLFGGGAVAAFRDYARDFPRAGTRVTKMLLIDRVIHECHKFPATADETQLYTRPAAINLIEGKVDDIVALLEALANGPESVPGALERLAQWRSRVRSAQRAGFSKPEE